MTRKLYSLLFCSLFLLAACTENSSTEQQTTADSVVTDTPATDTRTNNEAPQGNRGADINQFIRDSMPGWAVPESSEWEKYWYERYQKDRNTIYRVQSDFDGNGQGDYAFILKDSLDKFTVWAFMRQDDTYTPHRIYDITRLPNRKLHVGLSVLKAGTYSDLNTTDTVPAKIQTRHSAIHVVFFETAAKAYYWKDGSFHLIQTGD